MQSWELRNMEYMEGVGVWRDDRPDNNGIVCKYYCTNSIQLILEYTYRRSRYDKIRKHFLIFNEPTDKANPHPQLRYRLFSVYNLGIKL